MHFCFILGEKNFLFKETFQEKSAQTITGKQIAQIVYNVFEGTLLINLHS